jgi:predicted nucleotidyltransferase
MATESLHHDAIRQAREVLLGHPAVEAAYLLGSAAEDRLRRDSDVDVAIRVRRSSVLSVEDRLALMATLGTIFGRPVDLGLLDTSNLVYAKEAITRGRLIAERDHTVTATFAMYVLSMYATLQEARREVLRAYAA